MNILVNMKKIILYITLILGISLIILNYTIINKPVFSYKIDRTSNYLINLKPNSYYQETSVNNELIPSNLINNLKIDFDYKYLSTKKTNLNYHYKIEAFIISYNKDNIEVWKRDYLLKENSLNNLSNSFKINESINIDYNYYNNLAKSYLRDNNLNLNTILKVRLSVNINTNNIKIDDYLEYNISLTNNLTSINKYLNDIDENKDIYLKNNNIYYIIGFILVILSISLLIYDKYKKQDKLLNNYQDIIVNINEDIDTNLEIIYLKRIEDLINMAEVNNTNILLYKNKFYIILNNYIYLYVKEEMK